MGLTKTDLFTTEQNEISTLAKALGHPARIAILQHLIKSKTCINHDLIDELGLAQATISQHLRELKTLGIIKGTIEGTRMCYCIDPLNWESTRKALNGFLDSYQNMNSIDCC